MLWNQVIKWASIKPANVWYHKTTKLFFLAKISEKYSRQSMSSFQISSTPNIYWIQKDSEGVINVLTPDGSTCFCFVLFCFCFNISLFILATQSNKRIYTSYVPQCLAFSTRPTERSWDLNQKSCLSIPTSWYPAFSL